MLLQSVIIALAIFAVILAAAGNASRAETRRILGRLESNQLCPHKDALRGPHKAVLRGPHEAVLRGPHEAVLRVNLGDTNLAFPLQLSPQLPGMPTPPRLETGLSYYNMAAGPVSGVWAGAPFLVRPLSE